VSVIRILATGSPLGDQRRGLWMELGQTCLTSGMAIQFQENDCDGERELEMHVFPLCHDEVPGIFRLPIAEPLQFRRQAQLSLMPRATRVHRGRTEAVYLEYVDHSRRTA